MDDDHSETSIIRVSKRKSWRCYLGRISEKLDPKYAGRETRLLQVLKCCAVVDRKGTEVLPKVVKAGNELSELVKNCIKWNREVLDNKDEQLDPNEGHLPSEMDFVDLPDNTPGAGGFCPNTLFIREDDLNLFKIVRERQWIILTGNPGISNSMFQWKFLLFAARPEFWTTLSA